MRAALIAFLIFVSAQNAFADPGYYAVWLNVPAKSQEPVHLIVAGHGQALKTLFAEAAAGRAKRWLEVDPKRPVVLLLHNEIGRSGMELLFRQWGFARYSFREYPLSVEYVAREAKFFTAIASLDFFTHSTKDAAWLSSNDVLTIGGYDLPMFKGRFTKDAFVVLHGCNAGFQLAPHLAHQWHVPVAGALTSTDLQRFHSTGEFYAYNENTRPPGPWADENPVSYEKPRKCSEGACLRMKPDPMPYDGVHGKYIEGLPIMKFFCGRLSESACVSGMARSLLPASSMKPLRKDSPLVDWRIVLADTVCPIHAKQPMRVDCLSRLALIESGALKEYSPFMGKEISCDFETCHEGRTPGSLKGQSTFVREYLAYLKGLAAIGVKP